MAGTFCRSVNSAEWEEAMRVYVERPDPHTGLMFIAKPWWLSWFRRPFLVQIKRDAPVVVVSTKNIQLPGRGPIPAVFRWGVNANPHSPVLVCNDLAEKFILTLTQLRPGEVVILDVSRKYYRRKIS